MPYSTLVRTLRIAFQLINQIIVHFLCIIKNFSVLSPASGYRGTAFCHSSTSDVIQENIGAFLPLINDEPTPTLHNNKKLSGIEIISFGPLSLYIRSNSTGQIGIPKKLYHDTLEFQFSTRIFPIFYHELYCALYKLRY